MGIPIPGATREDFDKTRTESGSKPFPHLSGKWTNHTAQVASVEISVDQKNGNDQLVIRARNGEYECRIYVGLDPNRVGPDCQDINQAVQSNIDRLLKVGKCLEIITWKGNTPEIEPKLFKQATGKLIEFGIQGAVDKYGRPKINDRGYQSINTSFSGIARELRDVVTPTGAGSASPAHPAGTPPQTPPAAAQYGSQDIPF